MTMTVSHAHVTNGTSGRQGERMSSFTHLIFSPTPSLHTRLRSAAAHINNSLQFEVCKRSGSPRSRICRVTALAEGGSVVLHEIFEILVNFQTMQWGTRINSFDARRQARTIPEAEDGLTSAAHVWEREPWQQERWPKEVFAMSNQHPATRNSSTSLILLFLAGRSRNSDVRACTTGRRGRTKWQRCWQSNARRMHGALLLDVTAQQLPSVFQLFLATLGAADEESPFLLLHGGVPFPLVSRVSAFKERERRHPLSCCYRIKTPILGHGSSW